MDDKPGKPGLLLALGVGSKKSKPMPDAPASEPEMGEADSSEDFDAAAQNAFDAVSEGDLEGFKLALKTAVMACRDSDY